MSYFIIKIPSLWILGDMKVLPVTFDDAERAYKAARAKDVARSNVSTRINDALYVDCYHRVIESATEAEALQKAKACPVCRALRKSKEPIYLEDDEKQER